MQFFLRFSCRPGRPHKNTTKQAQPSAQPCPTPPALPPPTLSRHNPAQGDLTEPSPTCYGPSDRAVGAGSSWVRPNFESRQAASDRIVSGWAGPSWVVPGLAGPSHASSLGAPAWVAAARPAWADSARPSPVGTPPAPRATPPARATATSQPEVMPPAPPAATAKAYSPRRIREQFH